MDICINHDDCLYNIIQWLDINNVIKCMFINKQFYKMSKNNQIWKNLFISDFNTYFNFYYQPKCYLSYKTAYQKKIFYERWRKSILDDINY